jgi:hypothetical protein
MNEALFAKIDKSFDLQELEDFTRLLKKKRPKPMLLRETD